MPLKSSLFFRPSMIKCMGPNEYFTCGGECDNVCATLSSQNQTNCPYVNIQCNRKCYCQDGYARNDNNTCIPYDQCPPQQCGNNEEYVECRDSVCRPNTCNELGFPLACFQNPPCSDNCTQGPGCVCKTGYVRDYNGVCISDKNCPSCGGDPNAQSGSGTFCKTCDNYNQTAIACLLIAKLNSCDCKEGFVYDENIKKCVAPEQCTITCSENEVYDICPAPCPPRRCDVDEKVILCQTPPQPGDPDCNPRCRCKNGFYRNDVNICVTKDQCPEQTCGNNEEYVECKDSVCRPNTCNELGFPLDCLQNPPSSDNCTQGPGCVCKTGYVKDDNGYCISDRECPSCGGDANAQSGSGVFCKTCYNYNQTAIACPSYVLLNGCDCKEGFVYDRDLNKCIRPSQCFVANCTGQNEIKACEINCYPQTCESVSQVYNCPLQPVAIDCIPECRCKPDFFKNKANQCVSKEECFGCQENEVYTDNVNECRPQTCSELGFSLPCQNQSSVSLPFGNPGCVCNAGYVKDDNGICIPSNQCPSCGGDQNATAGCGINCGRTCTTFQVEKRPYLCPHICLFNSCDCKPNYVFDSSLNKCFLPEDCCNGSNSTTEENTNPTTDDNIHPTIDDNTNPTTDDNKNPTTDDNSCPTTVDSINPTTNGNTNPTIDDNTNPTMDDNSYATTVDNINPTTQDNINPTTDDNTNPTTDDNANPTIEENTNPTTDDNSCPTTDDTTNPTTDDNTNPTTDSTIEYPTDVSPVVCDTTEAEQQLLTGVEKVTAQFLYDAAKNNRQTSLVLSALSVIFVIAQLALGANGESLQQMLTFLNVDSQNQIRCAIPQYLDLVSDEKNVTLRCAQRIFGNENYEFSDTFEQDTTDIFHAKAQNLNFSNSTTAAKIINDWVESQTNNLIQNLIPESALKPSTCLVLANAVYFKGDWQKQFDPKKTKNETFFVTQTKHVTVEMMHAVDNYKYGVMEGSNAQMIQLDYRNTKFSFVVILPVNKCGIADLLEYVKNSTLVNNAIQSLKITKVQLSLPKFTIESSTDLEQPLNSANVTDIFDANRSGLTGILKYPKQLFVSAALQKAFIKLTETGTEAAAATGIVVGVTSVQYPPPQPVVFNADHVFVYYVLYNETPIFAGQFAGPQ